MARRLWSVSRNAGGWCFRLPSTGPSTPNTETQTDTRLLVIDKLPAADPKVFPASLGAASDVATLLEWVTQHVPPRLPVATSVVVDVIRRPAISPISRRLCATPNVNTSRRRTDLRDVLWSPQEGARLTDALYEEYGLQSVRIPGSCAHPTKLVQSAAMASVAPPTPSYRPRPASRVSGADGLLVGCSARERHLCGRRAFRLSCGFLDSRCDF